MISRLTTLVCFVLSSGCAAVTPYPFGLFYTDVTAPSPLTQVEADGEGKTGSKTGEACAVGWFGLVATGDASIDTAKKSAGITDVHAVDYRNESVFLGVYTESCTIVTGE